MTVHFSGDARRKIAEGRDTLCPWARSSGALGVSVCSVGHRVWACGVRCVSRGAMCSEQHLALQVK